MPASDFRVVVGFFSHPKTRKLERIVGKEGPARFLQLVEFCAMTPDRSRGVFDGMGHDDIEIAAGWGGGRGELVAALVKVRFLDDDNGVLSIHDFERHQPWVFNADERSKRAKAAADKRWGKSVDAGSNAQTPKSDAQTPKSDARSIENRCPVSVSVSVSDTDTDTDTETEKEPGREVGDDAKRGVLSLEFEKPKPKKPDQSAMIQTVWGAYREQHPHCSATLKSNDRRYKLIKARLKDGFPVAALVKAISGYHKSPFHLGDNDNGTKYLDLGLILRDPEHVEKGIGFDNDPPLPKNGNRAKDPRDDWD